MSDGTHGYGQIAYEAYGAAVDWTAYNGSPISPWEQTDPIRQHAWSQAAAHVAESVNATTAAVLLKMLPAHRRAAAVAEVARAIGVDPGAVSPVAPSVAARPLPLVQSAGTNMCGQGGCCADERHP